MSGKSTGLEQEYSSFTLNPSVLAPMMSGRLPLIEGKIIKRKVDSGEAKT